MASSSCNQVMLPSLIIVPGKPMYVENFSDSPFGCFAVCHLRYTTVDVIKAVDKKTARAAQKVQKVK